VKAPTIQKVDFKALLDDFRNLNPKDVGTWPVLPRAAALLGLFVVVLLAGWWFLWVDELDVLEARQKDEGKLKDEFVVKKKQAISLDLYIQQLNEMDRSFGALLKQLPNKSEVESLLVEINQAGMGRGLQFDLFKPGQEATKEFYAELPISVKITGNYHDFGAFAGDIGRLSRIVTLNNIFITSNPQAKDGSLAMDAVTKTFRYLDEEELARQKKAGQAAAKGGKK
jgi:type IV pilus assembly protein PilO